MHEVINGNLKYSAGVHFTHCWRVIVCSRVSWWTKRQFPQQMDVENESNIPLLRRQARYFRCLVFPLLHGIIQSLQADVILKLNYFGEHIDVNFCDHF